VLFVCCLIVVPLPPGENPFAVNNNNNNIIKEGGERGGKVSHTFAISALEVSSQPHAPIVLTPGTYRI
jgi:hypothetical protein